MNLDTVKDKWMAAATAAASTAALEEIRVEALGKKGEITGLMKGLGGLSPEERRQVLARLLSSPDGVSTGGLAALKAAIAEARGDEEPDEVVRG